MVYILGGGHLWSIRSDAGAGWFGCVVCQTWASFRAPDLQMASKSATLPLLEVSGDLR
jgi:hypothetical protein